MKTSLLLFASMFFATLLETQAQENMLLQSKVLDTIYANEHKNVALFFPEAIRQGITGAPNFIFTYNREKEQHFGLLQATPGEESNLLVIGAKDGVFSYILKYKETLNDINYFFDEGDKIAYENPVKHDSIPRKGVGNNTDELSEHFLKMSKSLMNNNQSIGKIKNSQNDIIFSIQNIVFDREELYFVVEIENKSSLDFDFGFLTIAAQSRQKGKRKSAQTLVKEPLYIYAVPDKIQKHKKKTFVYVLPKFSLNSDYRLIASLHEKQGLRDIDVNVSHRFINHPN